MASHVNAILVSLEKLVKTLTSATVPVLLFQCYLTSATVPEMVAVITHVKCLHVSVCEATLGICVNNKVSHLHDSSITDML